MSIWATLARWLGLMAPNEITPAELANRIARGERWRVGP